MYQKEYFSTALHLTSMTGDIQLQSIKYSSHLHASQGLVFAHCYQRAFTDALPKPCRRHQETQSEIKCSIENVGLL